MKTKDITNLLPYGYKRLRDHGSTALHQETAETEAFVFVQKIKASERLPELNQSVVDRFQSDHGLDSVIIDWFSDEALRYMIIYYPTEEDESYRLMANVTYGNETFEVRGSFTKVDSVDRKKIVHDRFFKNSADDVAEMEFAEERYDVLFPDHPLTHCRRIVNVLAMSAVYLPTNTSLIKGEK